MSRCGFAEAGARSMRDLLVELGSVRLQRATVVSGGGRELVLHAFIEARGCAHEIARGGR
jgi:hypothetical protein